MPFGQGLSCRITILRRRLFKHTSQLNGASSAHNHFCSNKSIFRGVSVHRRNNGLFGKNHRDIQTDIDRLSLNRSGFESPSLNGIDGIDGSLSECWMAGFNGIRRFNSALGINDKLHLHTPAQPGPS